MLAHLVISTLAVFASMAKSVSAACDYGPPAGGCTIVGLVNNGEIIGQKLAPLCRESAKADNVKPVDQFGTNPHTVVDKTKEGIYYSVFSNFEPSEHEGWLFAKEAWPACDGSEWVWKIKLCWARC